VGATQLYYMCCVFIRLFSLVYFRRTIQILLPITNIIIITSTPPLQIPLPHTNPNPNHSTPLPFTSYSILGQCPEVGEYPERDAALLTPAEPDNGEIAADDGE
jgi:hypothetical protein